MTGQAQRTLPVLLPVRPAAPSPFGPVPGLPRALFSPGAALLVAGALLLGCLGAEAQSAAAGRPGALSILAKWFPLIMSGFLVNLGVSVLSMAIGTAGATNAGLLAVHPAGDGPRTLRLPRAARLTDALTGSTTEHVVRKASCPVLSIPIRS